MWSNWESVRHNGLKVRATISLFRALLVKKFVAIILSTCWSWTTRLDSFPSSSVKERFHMIAKGSISSLAHLEGWNTWKYPMEKISAQWGLLMTPSLCQMNMLVQDQEYQKKKKKNLIFNPILNMLIKSPIRNYLDQFQTIKWYIIPKCNFYSFDQHYQFSAVVRPTDTWFEDFKSQ